MKKILITGSNGLLGQKLVYALRNREEYVCIATAIGENRLREKSGYVYEPLDITIEQEVLTVVGKYKPDVLINTAAMTNVDTCETEQEKCRQLNVEAVQYLVRACEETKAHLIHLSTDFVFDGESGPYKETDEPNPLSCYAQSKLDSEKAVENSNCKWAIVRTIIIYGIVDNMSRSNVVLWAKGALEKGEQINVVDDQFRSPTLAEDLAEGCLLIAEKEATGIYHISGKETMSILELVYRVADFYGLDKSLVNPISTASLNQAASRPPKTGFVLDKAITELGYNPHSFKEGLSVLDKQLKLQNG